MERKYHLSFKEAYERFITQSDSNTDNLKITITIPTHRTAPDYKQDSLQLKNQITEVERKLHELLDKRAVTPLMDKIKDAERYIDYSHNLDGLVIYADQESVSVIILPIELKPTSMVGEFFDVRPLYMTRQQLRTYYILTVSQQKIRLMKARNDTLLIEYDDENFPYDNTEYYTTDATKIAQDTFVENLTKEFYNVADKNFQFYTASEYLPTILAGDEKSISYYREMMDDDSMLIYCLEGNYDNTPTHEILKETYPLIEKYIENKQKEFMDNIDEAQSAHLATFDVNDIFRRAMEGNAKTLYIGENLSLKGKIDNEVLLIDKEGEDYPDSKELLSYIIDMVQKNGGNIIFVNDELLDEYQGIVLVRRY